MNPIGREDEWPEQGPHRRVCISLGELSEHLRRIAYGETSDLKLGRFSLRSEVGPQQDDPLGPLLFCLPLQAILLNLQSIWAILTTSLWGECGLVAADVETIERECRELGLSLNHTKWG